MKRRPVRQPESTKELTGLVLQACLVGKDAAFNLRDFIENSSNMAFIAVKDCEKELDRMERRVDEQITSAITEVTEAEARELLACLKFIIDLERIGDLTWSVAQRLQHLHTRLLRDDSRDLIAMAEVLEKMLEAIYRGFLQRDLEPASWVLQADSQIDHACQAVFRRHLESRSAAAATTAPMSCSWRKPSSAPATTPRIWARNSSTWWKAAAFATSLSGRAATNWSPRPARQSADRKRSRL